MDLIETLVTERFGTDAAREMSKLPGIFARGKIYRRRQISETLESAFRDRGGRTETAAVTQAIRKWLLGSDSPFRKVARGRYQFLGVGRPSEGRDDALLPTDDGRDPSEEISVAPERTFGSGPCEVYAWCLPEYQRKGIDRWPIKIGMAGEGGFTRRLRDFQENLPERPRYLLRLRCPNEPEAKRRESLLHSRFSVLKRRIDNVPGQEWFLTNPSEIEEALRFLIPSDDLVEADILERKGRRKVETTGE